MFLSPADSRSLKHALFGALLLLFIALYSIDDSQDQILELSIQDQSLVELQLWDRHNRRIPEREAQFRQWLDIERAPLPSQGLSFQSLKKARLHVVRCSNESDLEGQRFSLDAEEGPKSLDFFPAQESLDADQTERYCMQSQGALALSPDGGPYFWPIEHEQGRQFWLLSAEPSSAVFIAIPFCLCAILIFLVALSFNRQPWNAPLALRELLVALFALPLSYFILALILAGLPEIQFEPFKSLDFVDKAYFNTLASSLLLSCAILAWAQQRQRQKPSPLPEPQAKAELKKVLKLVATLVSAALLLTLLGFALLSGMGPVPFDLSELRMLLPSFGLHLLIFASLAALVEELFFRGIVQHSLENILNQHRPQHPKRNASLAIASSAILFMAVHIPQNLHSLPALLPILGVGLVAGLLKWQYRSLYPAMALHLLYNLIILFLSLDIFSPFF